MADTFKLTLNELEFAVEVPDGMLADITEVFSHINDYNSWKASVAVAQFTTGEGDEAVVDQVGLDAYATKARFFAVQLRDFVLDKYGAYKTQVALAAANAQVQAAVEAAKAAVVTVTAE
jgi:hypothetical protein